MIIECTAELVGCHERVFEDFCLGCKKKGYQLIVPYGMAQLPQSRNAVRNPTSLHTL
jgi:hypothetical protein